MAQQVDPVRRAPSAGTACCAPPVALADRSRIEALSMRNIAHELSIVPMALYKHVANKEQLLDGMVDVIIGEIDPPAGGTDWKSAIRQRILSARRALLRHAWALKVVGVVVTVVALVYQLVHAATEHTTGVGVVPRTARGLATRCSEPG
jgi:AcrR family transcriptional regulator